MKNPLNANNTKLAWWHNQAGELLPHTITSVGTGSRTVLRTDKHNRNGVLIIGYDDLKRFTDTPAGRWVIARLNTDPEATRISPILHGILAAAWLVLIINGVTSFTESAATALFLLVAGGLSATAHLLYLRGAVDRNAQTILSADRAASLDVGMPAAEQWFGAKIDGIYRTPAHAFLERRNPASLRNRAGAVSLEVTEAGEVTAA